MMWLVGDYMLRWRQVRYVGELTGLFTGSLSVSNESDLVAWHDGSQSCRAFL